MSSSTKMKATLPKDRDFNGMHAVRERLLKDPMAEHVAIVVLDCVRITDDIDDLVRTPTVRIKRIEPITDPDRAAALLAEAVEIAEARIAKPQPLLDSQEASGLRNATGLRLAGGGQSA